MNQIAPICFCLLLSTAYGFFIRCPEDDKSCFINGLPYIGLQPFKSSTRHGHGHCPNLFDEGCINGGLPDVVEDDDWIHEHGPGKRSVDFGQVLRLLRQNNGELPDVIGDND